MFRGNELMQLGGGADATASKRVGRLTRAGRGRITDAGRSRWPIRQLPER